jgi:predicted TIM-barrel fold metal-dependent hydrolase
MVLGHDGEGMPFWMNRTQGALDEYKTNGSRSLLDVWETNVWVTTSGQFTLAPFASVLESVHPSKIMFSVDYPIATNQEGVDFMNLLKDSGLISTAELEMIAHGNAAELLGITL